MIEAAWLGFVYGLGLSLMLGTVFFTLLRYGLLLGYKAGFFIASGVIFSDIIFISLAFWFTDLARDYIGKHTLLITMLGGVFILMYGLVGLLKQRKNSKDKEEIQELKPVKLATLGFVLNSSNPVNFIAWLAIQMLLVSKHYSEFESISFLVSSLLAILFIEIGIAAAANRIKKHLNHSVLVWVNRVILFIFMGVGFYLIAISLLKKYL